MLKTLIVLGCLFNLQAFANPAEEAQILEMKGESILLDGHPFIAVRAKEAGLTYDSERLAPEKSDFALKKAQKRADQICHNMNFVHAAKVSPEDLSVEKNVEGWLVEGSEVVKLVREERQISQLSWISLLAGSLAYKEPLVFSKLVCVK